MVTILQMLPEPLGGCNLCNRAVADALIVGRPIVPTSGTSKGYRYRDGAPVDFVCTGCDSRARTRVLAAVLAQAAPFLPQNGRALLIAAPRSERNVVAAHFPRFDHVSFQGQHGDPSCVVGVDITNMPHIASRSYVVAFASVVLDYIPEIEAALSEIERVLEPRGTFIFHIQPWRILENDSPPQVLHRNALAHEAYAAAECGETGVPDCCFGVRWLEQSAESAGVPLTRIRRLDPISELHVDWFVARKTAC